MHTKLQTDLQYFIDLICDQVGLLVSVDVQVCNI